MKKLVSFSFAFALLGASCGSSDSIEAFCDTYVKIDEQTESDADLSSPDALKDYFNTTQDTFDELADVAPSEIEDDAQTLKAAFEVIMGELENVDFDPLQIESDLFDNEDADEAAVRIEEFYGENCPVGE